MSGDSRIITSQVECLIFSLWINARTCSSNIQHTSLFQSVAVLCNFAGNYQSHIIRFDVCVSKRIQQVHSLIMNLLPWNVAKGTAQAVRELGYLFMLCDACDMRCVSLHRNHGKSFHCNLSSLAYCILQIVWTLTLMPLECTCVFFFSLHLHWFIVEWIFHRNAHLH